MTKLINIDFSKILEKLYQKLLSKKRRNGQNSA